jgi:hypothetical protein
LATEATWSRIQATTVYSVAPAPGRQPSDGADGHYEVILRGGLGDCFLQLFNRGAYTLLRDLSPVPTSAFSPQPSAFSIYAAVHNPHALELFDHHPNRAQITIHHCPVRNLLSDFRHCHAGWGIADQGHDTGNPHLPARERTFDFYPSPSDLSVLSDISRIAGQSPIIVLQHTAGERNRDIPSDLLDRICPILWEKGYFIVTIGRNYTRRPLLAEDARRFSSYCAVNQLTVPGVCRLLQQASGLITCHSSLNILAWYLRKPQLLLYPDRTRGSHFTKPDRWSFGKDFVETSHGTFRTFSDLLIRRFLASLKAP